MAERHRPSNLNPNPGRPQPSRIRGGGGNGGTTLSTVPRNLFQGGQPSSRTAARRPVPTSAPPSEALHLDSDVPGSDSSEIVVRDSHGEVELGDPPTPEREGSEEVMDSQQELEQARQRLAEAVKHHQINSSAMPEQPEELLEAVKSSLRAKVAALAEDDWMYEPAEPTSRGA